MCRSVAWPDRDRARYTVDETVRVMTLRIDGRWFGQGLGQALLSVRRFRKLRLGLEVLKQRGSDVGEI